MFDLTEAGRANLQAIYSEFERANRQYPPLCHLRLIPWSESKGRDIDINEAQWDAFIEAESDKVTNALWWEWDGPYMAKASFSSHYLGMFFGDEAGLDEFTDLVESVVDVLTRAHLPTADDYEVPFFFRSYSGWLSTLHSWAFKFQMPLLRCEMTVWENVDGVAFDELTERWGHVDDISYPLHPLCWTLTHNVFCSSMTAIRTILEPQNVIATNEPWPQVRESRQDVESHDPQECHQIRQTPREWVIVPAESQIPIHSSKQTGLQRIAVLIESVPDPVPGYILINHGGYPTRRRGRAGDQKRSVVEDGITETPSTLNKLKPNWQQDLKRVGHEIKELMAKRDKAQREEDDEEYQRLDALIRKIMEEYEWRKDGTLKPKEERQSIDEKKASDSVKKTIQEAIDDLIQQDKKLGNELADQTNVSKLVFEPKEGFVPWTVRRMA